MKHGSYASHASDIDKTLLTLNFFLLNLFRAVLQVRDIEDHLASVPIIYEHCSCNVGCYKRNL